MKVRISMPGATAVKEIEDIKAIEVFQKMVTELFETASEGIPESGLRILCHNMNTASKEEQREITEKFGQTMDLYLDAKGISRPQKENISMEAVGVELKYKGFLYLKCPKCGNIHGFCSKEQMTFYRCQDCGYKMPFHVPLVPLWVNCECGKRFKYLINLTESEFDINCIECGAPVAVTWNSKSGVYEPMKG